MTTGRMDAAGRARAPDLATGVAEQRFADALGGPDGTGDPAVLMPVLQVYPDALSAPMPDGMVALPPLDPNEILAAARADSSMPAAVPLPTPAQVRLAAQRAAADRMAQPGRRAPARSSPPPPPRPVPLTGTRPQPLPAAPRTYFGNVGLHTRPSQPAPMNSPADLARIVRASVAAMTSGTGQAAPLRQPAAHAPAPPLPRTTRRRNKGSSIWAVLVFLVVIAFASGIAQQLFAALRELLNR